MKLSDIIDELGLAVEVEDCCLDCEVRGCYLSDILSDVMANSGEGYLWVTIHIHPNITAVAQFKALAGVVVVNGRNPQPETLKKAEEHKIPIFTTDLSSYEIAGRLYAAGLRCKSEC
ncbi:MAG: serine kinase [Candidatus Coatesbacteria bacterium]|nr:serine kinase [Candidatus Coatesbacteria bacterium]